MKHLFFSMIIMLLLGTGCKKDKPIRYTPPPGPLPPRAVFITAPKVPSGTAFKVYVKRTNSPDWVEAINQTQGWSKYMWTIYNDGLEILEDQTEMDLSDTPDIKIVF